MNGSYDKMLSKTKDDISKELFDKFNERFCVPNNTVELDDKFRLEMFVLFKIFVEEILEYSVEKMNDIYKGHKESCSINWKACHCRGCSMLRSMVVAFKGCGYSVIYPSMNENDEFELRDTYNHDYVNKMK